MCHYKNAVGCKDDTMPDTRRHCEEAFRPLIWAVYRSFINTEEDRENVAVWPISV